MERGRVAEALRRPEAAAVAGLVFGVILCIVLALLHSVAPAGPGSAGDWVADAGRRRSVETSLALVPFGGIAFLWFVAVVRAHLGRVEDRLFETVFLGSGLLFVAMLFAGSAVLSATLTQFDEGTLAPGGAAQSWALAASLLGQFGARMAAVFSLAATTAGWRARRLPLPLALMGYLCGVLLLLSPPLPSWAQFLFPVWVMAVSVLVLVRRHQADPVLAGTDAGTDADAR